MGDLSDLSKKAKLTEVEEDYEFDDVDAPNNGLEYDEANDL